jgi:hypothetical protein
MNISRDNVPESSVLAADRPVASLSDSESSPREASQWGSEVRKTQEVPPPLEEALSEPDRGFKAASVLLAKLRQRTSEILTLNQELADVLSSLERESQGAMDLEERLRAVMKDTPSQAQTTALEDLLQTWSQRPSDLMVMVRLSEEAERLSGVVRAFVQIENILDRSPESTPSAVPE